MRESTQLKRLHHEIFCTTKQSTSPPVDPAQPLQAVGEGVDQGQRDGGCRHLPGSVVSGPAAGGEAAAAEVFQDQVESAGHLPRAIVPTAGG